MSEGSVSWPDEKVAVLRELWKRPEMSATKIGNIMGKSRSSILAKVKRLRDAGNLDDPPVRRIDVGTSQRARVRRERERHPVVVRHVERPVAPPIPETGGITIMQLGVFTCKWPFKQVDGQEQLYCGREVEAAGKSFCSGHAARAYGGKTLARL